MADQQSILFSDFYSIPHDEVDEYGAFDVSLIADLPLFIDPFLLFNSDDPTYQDLHADIIRYLRFLRDKSIAGRVNQGLLKSWYYFGEVKQTWLGFTRSGNSGSGLGQRFATELNSNFERLFGEDSLTIARGHHLEKLCLIGDRVGRDNISDFTTNLIKGFLLEYTQRFAKERMRPDQCRRFRVERSQFNYETESWHATEYTLPAFNDDYVILVPKDILTRDATWINREDLLLQFRRLPLALENESLRAQIDNYFASILPKDATRQEALVAKRRTIAKYPILIDAYIRQKEDTGDQAVSVSNERVRYAKSLFLENFTALARLVASKTTFAQHDPTSPTGAMERLECVKVAVEQHGGFKYLHDIHRAPVTSEADLRIAYQFIWLNAPVTGTAPFVQSTEQYVPVVFKLASNRSLGNHFAKVKELQAKGTGVGNACLSLTAVFAFDPAERRPVERALREAELDSKCIVYIDASYESQRQRANVDPSHPYPPARVFLSYTHDTGVWMANGQDPETHKRRVFDLARRLREQGIDAMLDQLVDSPPAGWPRWMVDEVERADYVLVVATETYARRFAGKEQPGVGLGATWEGGIIVQKLYEAAGTNHKFIPVIFDAQDAAHIPSPLRSATWYNVGDEADLQRLCRRLRNDEPSPPLLGSP